MTEIHPYSPAGIGLAAPFGANGRLARQASKELSRLDAQVTVGIGQIAAQTELQLAKVHALAQVGRGAMQEAAFLTQVETQLATAFPASSGRVAGMAELTCVAMSEVVLDSARRVGRC